MSLFKAFVIPHITKCRKIWKGYVICWKYYIKNVIFINIFSIRLGTKVIKYCKLFSHRSASTSFEDALIYTDHKKTLYELKYPKRSPGLPVTQALELNGLKSLHSEYEILLPKNLAGPLNNKYKKKGYNIIEWKLNK